MASSYTETQLGSQLKIVDIVFQNGEYSDIIHTQGAHSVIAVTDQSSGKIKFRMPPFESGAWVSAGTNSFPLGWDTVDEGGDTMPSCRIVDPTQTTSGFIPFDHMPPRLIIQNNGGGADSIVRLYITYLDPNEVVMGEGAAVS